MIRRNFLQLISSAVGLCAVSPNLLGLTTQAEPKLISVGIETIFNFEKILPLGTFYEFPEEDEGTVFVLATYDNGAIKKYETCSAIYRQVQRLGLELQRFHGGLFQE